MDKHTHNTDCANIEERKTLYYAAMRKWGKELQICMLHEEIGELMQSLSKLRRNADGENLVMRNNLAEEIADVHIMLEQLTHMFMLYYEVATHKKQKLERLEKMLND